MSFVGRVTKIIRTAQYMFCCCVFVDTSADWHVSFLLLLSLATGTSFFIVLTMIIAIAGLKRASCVLHDSVVGEPLPTDLNLRDGVRETPFHRTHTSKSLQHTMQTHV